MANKPNLVIVESPSKAKTIGKYLGPEYTVKASMGHLRDLPKSTMGVDLDSFAPEYIPVPGKEKLIEELRQASKDAKTVYLATDPDREGEAISWHLKELLNLPDGVYSSRQNSYQIIRSNFDVTVRILISKYPFIYPKENASAY